MNAARSQQRQQQNETLSPQAFELDRSTVAAGVARAKANKNAEPKKG